MQSLANEIKSWLIEAGEIIKRRQENYLTVTEKTNRKDLVTNMDKQIQGFLIEKIRHIDPTARILAEEDGRDRLEDFAHGRVYVIDPIDGTMNFVMESENFCIMLAVYEEGIGKLGFIYDVMRSELYWGGQNMGVFKENEQLEPPVNKNLSEGLLGINAYMYGHDAFNARTIGDQSIGIRVTGCAGLELIALLKGNRIGYLSKLSPWDYAAGAVLLNEFSMKYSNFEGGSLAFHGREFFVAATANAYKDIMEMLDYVSD
ncbi:MAG: inositol monophosphatase family protein [Enterococcus sp.]